MFEVYIKFLFSSLPSALYLRCIKLLRRLNCPYTTCSRGDFLFVIIIISVMCILLLPLNGIMMFEVIVKTHLADGVLMRKHEDDAIMVDDISDMFIDTWLHITDIIMNYFLQCSRARLTS